MKKNVSIQTWYDDEIMGEVDCTASAKIEPNPYYDPINEPGEPYLDIEDFEVRDEYGIKVTSVVGADSRERIMEKLIAAWYEVSAADIEEKAERIPCYML
jgi:hypothetical protein